MDLPLMIGGIPIIPINLSEPPSIIAMRALSLVGTIPVVALATLTVGLLLLWRRRRTNVILLAVTVCGGELIGLLLKWLFVQPRPRWPDPLVVFTSASFPSGHAMRSLVFFSVVSYLLMLRIGSWPARIAVSLASGGVVLMVGVSRVYLEAHTLIDVLAGYAAGVGWLGFVIIATAKRKLAWQRDIHTTVEAK